MEAKFTEQQSLATINEMICQARNYYRKGSAASFTFWGWTIAVIALAHFVLLYIPGAVSPAAAVWLLTVPAWVVNFFMERRIDRSGLVRTPISVVIGHVWIGFLVSVVLFLAAIFTLSAFESLNCMLLITPGIMILVGMAQYVTARACRFRPFLWGAVGFWVGAALTIVSYSVLHQARWQFVILAACMLGGFVLPARMLNCKASKDVR